MSNAKLYLKRIFYGIYNNGDDRRDEQERDTKTSDLSSFKEFLDSISLFILGKKVKRHYIKIPFRSRNLKSSRFCGNIFIFALKLFRLRILRLRLLLKLLRLGYLGVLEFLLRLRFSA
jgi:hypothetical protein